MTTSRRNTIMSWMAYTEFFYPGCELQPGYFYLSIPELYYIPEDGACIGAAGVDAYVPSIKRFAKIRELLQASNISSMDDIQNLLKETIAEFMENGLESELMYPEQ